MENKKPDAKHLKIARQAIRTAEQRKGPDAGLWMKRDLINMAHAELVKWIDQHNKYLKGLQK